MKKYINKLSVILILVGVTFQSCSDEIDHTGDLVFNDDTTFPYVSIQDRNEDLEDIPGNNFWNFRLTSENDGNQVRVEYRSQDNNIISHQIIVGFDGGQSPPEDGVILMTLTEFPSEIVITKQDIANALNVPIEDLEAPNRVFFGGLSIDEDDNVVDDPSVFETFLVFERHAYFYEWRFAD